MTPTQARTAQAIINLFETSQVLGDYGKVTLIPGDTGLLTFGRSQTTLGSGNLGLLLQRYCANPGARFGARLSAFVPRFMAIDSALNTDQRLHNILRATADDAVMREVQDVFFDQAYWQPSVRAASRLGISTPLGVAVVYDGHVQGSFGAMRDRTTATVGTPAAAGERGWVIEYLRQRHQWLANHGRADLRATVYRMEAFGRLAEQGFWGLELPLVVRSREISALTLSGMPPGCYDGPQPGTRPLALQAPLHRGLDVRLVQLGLSDLGVDIRADGVFGQTSMLRVRDWQAARGLPVSGVLDAAQVALIVG